MTEAVRPVEFLCSEVIDGCLHVEKVLVDPGSASGGLGQALLDYAAEPAAPYPGLIMAATGTMLAPQRPGRTGRGPS